MNRNLAISFVCITLAVFLFAGCATRSIDSTIEKPRLITISTPVSRPSDTFASASEKSQERSFTKSIAAQLPGKYVILEASSITLFVKKPGATFSASLFEEAIVLNKLRGSLKVQPRIPSKVAANTTLQNGTATIPFTRSISSSDAAVAITAALDVDGVQRVCATFCDPS